MLFTLPETDRSLIRHHLTLVTLDRGVVLKQPDKAVDTAFFLTSGVAAMLAQDGKDRFIEVGIAGREGMAGLSSVLIGSGCSPIETRMQVAGQGLSIQATTLRDLLDRSATMHRHLLLYLHALLVQMSHTALANGKAKLEQRLARWLLMYHDRIDGNRISLTHKSISLMLGVRRAGVTTATHLLEGAHLIRANRGEILILDRGGLEERARGFYGAPEAEYDRLFGSKASETTHSGRTQSYEHDEGQLSLDFTRE